MTRGFQLPNVSVGLAGVTNYQVVKNTFKNLFVADLDVASLKLRCQQVWFPLSSVSLACTWQSSHCALHLAFSLCSGVAGFPFSYVNTSHFVLNPTLVTSFNHYYLFKSLVSEYSHILRQGGLEFQFMNFEGTQIHSITP